jgi:hypothetical protein
MRSMRNAAVIVCQFGGEPALVAMTVSHEAGDASFGKSTKLFEVGNTVFATELSLYSP